MHSNADLRYFNSLDKFPVEIKWLLALFNSPVGSTNTFSSLSSDSAISSSVFVS